jgi:exosortase
LIDSRPTDDAALTPWTWRHAAALLAFASIVVYAYRSSFASMVALWQDSSYQHCWFVPVISIGLLWHNRRRLDGRWTGSWYGFAMLGASIWLWIVARLSLLQAAEHVAVLLIYLSLVWSVLGSRAFARISASQLYLLLMLPIGTEVIPFLMLITADIAAAALSLTGFPVLREGMFFTLPGGEFEVAAACSGLRYLNAGLATSVLVALISFESVSRRMLFVGVAVVALITVNGIRAFVTMAIASSTDMTYLVSDDHIVFGWVMYALAIGALCWLAFRFNDHKVKRAD